MLCIVCNVCGHATQRIWTKNTHFGTHWLKNSCSNQVKSKDKCRSGTPLYYNTSSEVRDSQTIGGIQRREYTLFNGASFGIRLVLVISHR